LNQIRRLIATVGRAGAMLLFVGQACAHAEDTSSINGVWKGSLGTRPITACYSSGHYGFYYYDNYATPIRLSLYSPSNVSDMTQLRFKEELPLLLLRPQSNAATPHEIAKAHTLQIASCAAA
jgi:hypothetical protein